MHTTSIVERLATQWVVDRWSPDSRHRVLEQDADDRRTFHIVHLESDGAHEPVDSGGLPIRRVFWTPRSHTLLLDVEDDGLYLANQDSPTMEPLGLVADPALDFPAPHVLVSFHSYVDLSLPPEQRSPVLLDPDGVSQPADKWFDPDRGRVYFYLRDSRRLWLMDCPRGESPLVSLLLDFGPGWLGDFAFPQVIM